MVGYKKQELLSVTNSTVEKFGKSFKQAPLFQNVGHSILGY